MCAFFSLRLHEIKIALSPLHVNEKCSEGHHRRTTNSVAVPVERSLLDRLAQGVSRSIRRLTI